MHLCIIFYKEFKKRSLKLSKFILKKVGREFKVAMVIQVPKIIGLVLVDS